MLNDILDNAESYLKASDILEKNREFIGFTNSPYLTCLAFSLELYLKTLLRRYPPKKKIKGSDLHNWHVLFNALPANVRDNLFRRWCEANPSVMPKQNFEFWLIKEGNNFQEWRYHHEFYERDFSSPKVKSATMTFHPYKARALIEAIRGFLFDIKNGNWVDTDREQV